MTMHTPTDEVRLLEDQIQGLRTRLAGLKQTEKMFLQASGIEGQVAQARKQAEGLAGKIADIKANYDALILKQGAMTQKALDGFLAAMNAALPEGEAYVEIGEKSVAMGWSIDGVKRPLQALSGGERVAFDIALANALGATILIKEVAELDDQRLQLVLEKLGALPQQVILVTCHTPVVMPDGWSTVVMQ